MSSHFTLHFASFQTFHRLLSISKWFGVCLYLVFKDTVFRKWEMTGKYLHRKIKFAQNWNDRNIWTDSQYFDLLLPPTSHQNVFDAFHIEHQNIYFSYLTLVRISYLIPKIFQCLLYCLVGAPSHWDNPSCLMSSPYLSNKDSVKAVTQPNPPFGKNKSGCFPRLSICVWKPFICSPQYVVPALSGLGQLCSWLRRLNFLSIRASLFHQRFSDYFTVFFLQIKLAWRHFGVNSKFPLNRGYWKEIGEIKLGIVLVLSYSSVSDCLQHIALPSRCYLNDQICRWSKWQCRDHLVKRLTLDCLAI